MKIWKVLVATAPIKKGYGVYTHREMLIEYGFADAEIIGVYDNREAAEKRFNQYNGSIYSDSIKGYILAEYETGSDPDDPAGTADRREYLPLAVSLRAVV